MVHDAMIEKIWPYLFVISAAACFSAGWLVNGWCINSNTADEKIAVSVAREEKRDNQDAITSSVVADTEKTSRELKAEERIAIRYVEKIIPVTDDIVLPDSFRVFYNATVQREFSESAGITDDGTGEDAAHPG